MKPVILPGRRISEMPTITDPGPLPVSVEGHIPMLTHFISWKVWSWMNFKKGFLRLQQRQQTFPRSAFLESHISLTMAFVGNGEITSVFKLHYPRWNKSFSGTGGSETVRSNYKRGKIIGFRIRLIYLGSNSGSATSNWLYDYEQIAFPFCAFLWKQEEESTSFYHINSYLLAKQNPKSSCRQIPQERDKKWGYKSPGFWEGPERGGQ